MYATYLIYLDPPFGCQISANKVYFLVGFLGPNFQKIWRIQVYKHTFWYVFCSMHSECIRMFICKYNLYKQLSLCIISQWFSTYRTVNVDKLNDLSDFPASTDVTRRSTHLNTGTARWSGHHSWHLLTQPEAPARAIRRSMCHLRGCITWFLGETKISSPLVQKMILLFQLDDMHVSKNSSTPNHPF